MSTRFRAEVKLSRLTDREPDGVGFVRADSETVAAFEVVADTADQAMSQIYSHTSRLAEYHQEAAK